MVKNQMFMCIFSKTKSEKYEFMRSKVCMHTNEFITSS